MAKFACIAVLSFIQMSIDEDSHSDTIMDINMNHIPTAIVEGGLSKYRKIGLIFDDYRNTESFFQKAAQLRIWQWIIRGKYNSVILYNSINAHRNPQDFSL